MANATTIANLQSKIKEINGLIKTATRGELDAKFAELKEIEDTARKENEIAVFKNCETMHDLLVAYRFESEYHKEIREKGVLVRVEESTREYQVDPVAYCEYRDLPTDWKYEVQRLNKRLTLKAATELGFSTAAIREINDSYSMDKLCKELESGATVTSDTQITKHIQSVLDALSPDEGRVNGHDLAYIMLCYAKRDSKKALSVACAKHAYLMTLLTDVFHRVATNGVYSVNYKAKRELAQKQEAEPVVTKKPAKAKGKAKAAKVAEPAKAKAAKVAEPAEKVEAVK